ncbi:nicotinate phosphoribosyltransferase [Mastigocoleus sp. MO_188.B34]|uniref:nicotinate phosphoribosyltransferase n=1 Tax=Mastigocoleus sp. MO_188.B34 TaxID=3036635 RepID=UPI002619B033|nr:nicotinate phosphoribosyltransferase [Mastigocoleus sp. MO_188.B34]MDJ0696744.1 nicotinate phosphoribosyltransferase [Mastigocoleus sp. MO_188.B34]
MKDVAKFDRVYEYERQKINNENQDYENQDYENQSYENQELTINSNDYSLLTDLYQLTMAACYHGEGVEQKKASFELFVRRLPKGFSYLIAMGLAQVLEYLEKLRFSDRQIKALQATGIFAKAPEEFWQLLTSGGFSGDVWAVPEGTVVFANEPILRVEAPLWQAQLVETYILNAINYQTLIATRAARLRDIAGKSAKLLEFGTRRAFSPQGALWAARAALTGGFDATSNVLAALLLGTQPSGTMAHALVMALSAMEGDEDKAFTAFHRYFPGAPLLIDTYDTIAAAERLAARVNSGEIELSGVRLDSGDLVELSQKVRSLLGNVPILASGDIDEWEIARLKAAGAQIDGYGIGTKLVTGEPVNGVYKLVEIDGIPVMKESSGKLTYPGRKQIFRYLSAGKIQADCLSLATEDTSGESKILSQGLIQEPLLKLIMKSGQRVAKSETIAQIRERTTLSVENLPESVRKLNEPGTVNVEISPALIQLSEQTRRNK